ncbi:MAG: DUF2813 domain-containing protein [Sulfurovum sp.]
MRIKKIELKNFKFHKDLEFEIKNDNCLIYGENGTGKSSIYEALYSIFKVYFRNKDFTFYKFKNNNAIDDLSVKVTLDNDTELIIPNENYKLPDNIEVKNKKTIYFINQDLLESLILYDNNFYGVIESNLKKYFTKLDIFCNIFDKINSDTVDLTHLEKAKLLVDNLNNLKNLLIEVENSSNDIIKNDFKEDFEISFEYRDTSSDNVDDIDIIIYPTPNIILKIDNKDNLKQNFNEAKLKLTSIAIFFALIKLEEDKSNPLKLLVLDDFLTSLDMANRHYIIEYILNEFDDYQKIILTHNLQFYNLIIKLLKSKEDNSWDIKNIFLNVDKEALIYTKETDYIKVAKTYLNTNSLDEAGIYLRKEFERIVEELRIITQVGAKEKLSNIIKQLLDLSDTEDINIKKMQNILKKTKFYQQTILHSTAHDDIENEKYIKELNGEIVILTLLNKQINILKKEN